MSARALITPPMQWPTPRPWLKEEATVAGPFSCYGEVNPKVLEKVKAKPQPPVWLNDTADAVGHPKSSDLDNLLTALKAVLK